MFKGFRVQLSEAVGPQWVLHESYKGFLSRVFVGIKIWHVRGFEAHKG